MSEIADALAGPGAPAPAAGSSPPEPVLDPRRLDGVFRLVEGQIERGELQAAALAVAGPGGIVRSQGFGRDGDRRVGIHDRFPVASITKPIAATAVAQLLEEGLVALAQPVRTIVPEYDPPPSRDGGPGGAAVTVWHLLTHTSGSGDLAEHTGDTMAMRLRAALPDEASVDRLLRLVGAAPLRFAPGSAYSYASDPFLVLGEMVRRRRGAATFGEALRTCVLAPLGMTATGFEPDIVAAPSVRPHVDGVPDEEAERIGLAMASIEHPGGGLWSTVGDLARFGRMVLHGGTLDGARILGRHWLDVMTREQTFGILEVGTGRRAGYGLGWAVSTPSGPWPGSPRRVGHRGASGSYLSVDPELGLVVVLLADRWGAPEWLQDAVVDAVYGALA